MSTSEGNQANPHPGGATTSIWQGTFEVPNYPKLERSGSTDICVVGAGIAGLSVAYHLARKGKKVVVMDDGPIGGGESGRTTAHLVDAMDDRIYWLEHVHGEEGARLIVESHGAAINRIQQIVQLEGIRCDFERLDGYLISEKPGERGGRDENHSQVRRRLHECVDQRLRANIGADHARPHLRDRGGHTERLGGESALLGYGPPVPLRAPAPTRLRALGARHQAGDYPGRAVGRAHRRR